PPPAVPLLHRRGAGQQEDSESGAGDDPARGRAGLILRRIGAVILGLAAAWLIVAAAEAGVHQLYPPTAGTDMHHFAAIKAYVANLPLTAFLLVLIGWLFGAFAGVFIATTVGRGAVSGYIVGVLLLAAGILN